MNFLENLLNFYFSGKIFKRPRIAVIIQFFQIFLNFRKTYEKNYDKIISYCQKNHFSEPNLLKTNNNKTKYNNPTIFLEKIQALKKY